jgi:hypothetical protein
LFLAYVKQCPPQFDPLPNVDIHGIRAPIPGAGPPASATSFHCDDCQFYIPLFIVLSTAILVTADGRF